MKALVIGFGNPGRRDDGLGVALAEAVERWRTPGLEVFSDYQLNIEYAADAAKADLVIFIDASVEAEAPFGFYRIGPAARSHFTTHAMEPQSVLAVCREVYQRVPESYLLAVRGECFEIGEGFSPAASGHFKAAGAFLENLLKQGDPLEQCRKAARDPKARKQPAPGNSG